MSGCAEDDQIINRLLCWGEHVMLLCAMHMLHNSLLFVVIFHFDGRSGLICEDLCYVEEGF